MSADSSTAMIEYIDSIAHLFWMDAYKAISGDNPDWKMYDHCAFKAEALERSAMYFRRIDPELHPRRNRPHPSSYFQGGEALRTLVEKRLQAEVDKRNTLSVD
ncbi:hypothetical protein SEA_PAULODIABOLI_210 [Microbacterium phage PauloDiaboli]|nr:hypothetical protein SEA_PAULODIABOLI_210 [Microbacterium phage PauloDiaboli]QWY84018.1 hypothetical protein SEA_A3WALLY_211 [Microbacterium phage A3Wally]